jgi:hypothetical protein
MNKKTRWSSGLCLLVISGTSLAALTATEKSYVERLVNGGFVTLRDVAKNMFDAGITNTEVLDVAAEVLLQKYPRAGDDPDAVDGMAWMCKALGKSDNGRYRAVLEKVEKDSSAHRKLRGYCEEAADSLPRKAADPYIAGTVNLAALREPGSAVTPGPATTASADASTAGPSARMNPPPANKLKGYAGYELKPVTLADEAAGKKNIDKVVAKIDENLKQSVTPILTEWTASAAPATSSQKLVIEPHILGVHKPSGASRFWAGAFAGEGYIVMRVKISEQPSGKVVAEPEFYRRANAMAGAWTMGAHDNAMLQRTAGLLANYLTENYTAAVGGATGFEP